jgi:hypothetical protein
MNLPQGNQSPRRRAAPPTEPMQERLSISFYGSAGVIFRET